MRGTRSYPGSAGSDFADAHEPVYRDDSARAAEWSSPPVSHLLHPILMSLHDIRGCSKIPPKKENPTTYPKRRVSLRFPCTSLQALLFKYMIFYPLVHIRTGCLISFSGQYDFSRSASISRHKNFTAGKTAHTDSAMIAATGAGPVFRFHTERFYFRSAWQGRSMLFSKLIFGFKCHSIGTHEARNIRTDDFLSRQTFKSAEYRVIIKGTAFRHDMIPQLFSRLQLNDAEERIFDHRYGKRRRKICQSHTAVLHLFT